MKKTFIISGFCKQFNSSKDLEYKILLKQKRKLEKLYKKIYKKYLKEKEYCFLSNSELELIKSKREDSIKIQSHGFDENSFKGEHYHGQKRKKKN